MSQQQTTTMEMGAHVHGLLRMNCNEFSDPLTFYQVKILSNVAPMVCFSLAYFVYSADLQTLPWRHTELIW